MERINDPALIHRFAKDCQIRNLSRHTIVSYISNLHLFITYLHTQKRHLLSVDKNVLRDYVSFLRQQGLSQKTIENRFSTLSSFYEYVVYEQLLETNIVLDIRKRYLQRYKKNEYQGSKRKLVSIEDMSLFINQIFDLRTKTIAIVFAKTGIRLRELIAIDLEDINWNNMSIQLKPTHKRSNLEIFFDYETSILLKRWIKKREIIAYKLCNALFVSYNTQERLHRNAIYSSFISWAEKAGLHNSSSNRMEDHFTPHCCRHWFTTYLRRAGMPREFIKELRGDKQRDSMDIYNHIDREELRKSYLACIPQLGIE